MSLNELVDKMLKILQDEWHNSKEIKKWKSRLKNKPPNVGIRFPSCNYDTYIFDIDGALHVDTCNNHLWNTEIEYYNSIDESKMHKIMKNKLFFDLEKKTVHSNEKYFRGWENWENRYSCPKCNKEMYHYYLNEFGKKMCPECGKIFSRAKLFEEKK